MIPPENRTDKAALPFRQELLDQITETILTDYYETAPEFSVSFVTPEEIRSLNKTYREVDAVTDVLSFESGGEMDPETGIPYLGDIVICLDRAMEQADKSGHPVENEIILLVIHGLLHLLGFDHADVAEKEEMWTIQQSYLDRFGIKLGKTPGEEN